MRVTEFTFKFSMKLRKRRATLGGEGRWGLSLAEIAGIFLSGYFKYLEVVQAAKVLSFS